VTLRDDLLPVLDDLRQIPVDLGLRLNQVFRVVRTWSGGMVGAGNGVGADYTDDELELTPRPRVREEAMGRRLVVEPVSQRLPIATVHPKDSPATEVLYRVAGPNAGYYQLVEYSVAKPFRQRLVLQRLERRQPQPEA
jgi:hypothetical protein